MRPASPATPVALVVLLATATAVAAQGTPSPGRAFTPADWYRVTTVAAPVVSPDGARIAFTVTTVNEAENRRHSEIWMVGTGGGAPVRLTSPGTESTNPRFSDDGSLLLFSSTRPGGRGNTWALRMDQPGEAFQPATVPPAIAPGMRPADRSFTIHTTAPAGGSGGRGGGAPEDTSAAPAAADPFGRMAPMARPPWDAVTRPLDVGRFDGRHVTHTGYKSNGAGFVPGARVEPPKPAPRPIQIQIDRGSGRVNLTATAYSHRNVAVSPDGRWLAFTADAALRPDSVVTAERDSIAKLPPDRRREQVLRNDTDIFLLPVAACEAKEPACTPRRIDYAGAERSVVWSPDSRQLAFIGQPGRYRNARLFVVPAAGGRPRELLGTWTYEPSDIEWLRSGKLSMQAEIGGSNGVFLVDPATGAPTPVLGGRRRHNGTQHTPDQSKLVYVATDQTHPTELFIANADGSGERKLTTFNDRLNAEIAWSGSERFTYRSVGGLEIEAWLMKPHGYQPGRRYPVVTYIHGGPHSAYGEGWFDEFQNLAGAGMFVLFTNPRGSSGTNTEFTYASLGDWGGKDYQDIMKAVDLVAARPDIDSTRMGVTGGSYGGFMTAWITTKTNRFKAAQADRMISDWISWWGTSDAQGLTDGEFFGSPWQNAVMYDTLSPIRFVHRVKTPTLIVQSEEDHRTPMVGAEMWFMSLKRLNVPVELVRYPRSTHDLSRTGEPWLLVDRLGRLRQWFLHYLGTDN